MNDYNKYVTAVNKIFDYLAKMKAGWANLDNINYISSIEEYRQTVASNVTLFKGNKIPNQQKSEGLEALGND